MYIEPYVMMDRTVRAKLNIDDLDIPNKENLEHLLLFHVGTYVKLTAIGKVVKPDAPHDGPLRDDNWDMTFANINAFFNTLTKEQQTVLAQGFIMMHHTIQDFFNTKFDILQISQTMRTIAEQLDAVDQEIDLMGNLRKYVDNNMVVGLYEGAGKRAQDSDKLTFQPEQVKYLMSITLLCKMLCPIYGAIIAQVEKFVDTKLKETHCVAILTKMYQRRCPELIEKLMHYIGHTVKQHSEESPSGLMHGYDDNSLAYHMYGILMVRQFVNVDLRVRNGNLMTYIIVSVKRALNTIRSAVKRDPTYTRKQITSKHEEDGNTAQLEIDSMTSKKTLDVGPIISAAVDPAIKEYMAMYQIDQESYDESLAFYQNHPIVPNPINKDVNAMFFSRKLGGGNGLLMLRGPEYTKITVLMQLIIFSLDVNFYELGHMMTAQIADTAVDTTINPSTFKVRVGSSQSYRAVKQMFDNNPYGIRGKDWDAHVSKITENITTNKYLYNTSNFLWNWRGEDNLNGKVFAPSDLTITAMCSLYEFFMKTNESEE